MKKGLFLQALLVLMLQALSQDTTMHPLTSTELLKKSKSQKTAGGILLGTGAGMVLVGAATFKIQNPIVQLVDEVLGSDPSTPRVNNTGPVLLAVGGLGAIISGAAILGSSNRNKKSAATLSIHNQPIPLLQQYGLASKMQPTVRLRILL